jgi:glucose repression mediator protein
MESRHYLEKVNLSFEESFSIAAEVASELGSKEECLEAAKRALSYNPNNDKVLLLANSIKPQINAIRKLIDENCTRLQKEKEKYPIWKNLCSYYLALGDFPNSFAALAHILQSIDKNDNNFLYAAGVVYAHFHYSDVAISFFQQILANEPSFYLANDFAFRLGVLYRNIDRITESNEAFQSIMQPPFDLKQNDIQLQIAYNLSKAGQQEAALSMYQQMHTIYPKNIKLTQQYFIAKLLFSEQSQLRELQYELNNEMKAMEFDPILALVDARISIKIDDTKVAFEKCKKCINYCSDSPYFWISLGVLYFKNDQSNDAITSFQRALYLRYDIPEPWLNIGLVHELRGDTLDAGRMYQTGLQRCPNCSEFSERLKSTKHNYNMLEISDDRFFIQIPEKFAKDYISAVPPLPQALFPESITVYELNKLSSIPKSIFENE